MPKLSKQIISKYIKTGCKRFLALSLYRNKSDQHLTKFYNMPEPIVARPSTTIFAKAGKKAEDLLYDLIQNEFPAETIKFDKLKNGRDKLLELLNNNLEDKFFLLEPQFVTDDILEELLNILGYSLSELKDELDMSDIRPDLIVKIIPKDDEIYYEVKPDGTLLKIENFERTMLSIIDIKNTEKSNSGFDAEVVLYSILLTIWLKNNQLNDKYIVTSKSGIFPAALKVNPFNEQYEPLIASNFQDKYFEIMKYVEFIEHDQIVISLRKILADDVMPILISPEKWKDLDWHISKKCGLCDWLAYEEWLSDENKKKITDSHCYVNALSNEHLSQIPFMTSAMRKVLENDCVFSIYDVEKTDGTETIYSKHSKLKIDSGIIPKRANSILNGSISHQDRFIYSIPKEYETFTNIFITVNFDPSSRLVSSLSTKCHWKEYSPSFNEKEKYKKNFSFPATVFFTEEGDERSEREMLFLFFQQMNEYFEYANNPENNTFNSFKQSNYHIYFWDRTQFDELKKLIGKHLGVILSHGMYKSLIWLFGSEDLLEDFGNIKTPRVSFLKNVIKSNLALSLQFDYTLFNVAKVYTDFNKIIPKAFYDPLSDYIPKERLYEIWFKHKNYQDTKDKYRATAKSQVEALQFIAVQVQRDLKHLIKGSATTINFDLFNNFKGISRLPTDSKLWYLHQRLNEEYSLLDNELDSFKDPNELEAKYKAIILEELLNETDKTNWMSINSLSGDFYVYRTTEASKNTKIKDNAKYLSVGVRNINFLNCKFGYLIQISGLDGTEFMWASRLKMKDLFQMNIVHFDRENGIIALELSNKKGKKTALVDFIIRNQLINMNDSLYLIESSSFKNSVHTLAYLNAIQTPLVSHASPKTLYSIGLDKDILGKKTHPDTMAADILWNANELEKEKSSYTVSDLSIIDDIFKTLDNQPNDKQREAIFRSLIGRLTIIWGPPGTGKTATASLLVKVLLSLILIKNENKTVLLSAFTYQACIEIFEKLYPLLDVDYSSIKFYMIKSKERKEFDFFLRKIPTWMNLIILDEKESLLELKNNLSTSINVIISPTAALNSFYNDNHESDGFKNPIYSNIGKFIDFALLDEASQCDVSSTLSALYGLKKTGQLVILGDHLQMPPIHQVKPPLGIEHNVGSFLVYLRDRHKISPIMLNVNYRSLPSIVNYISTLGYEKLYSFREISNITISDTCLVHNIFREELQCDDLFDSIISINNDVMSLTYSDGISSQANLFESKLVAGAIIDAYNKFFDSSQNIDDYNEWFWTKGIGVVTPHKAQKVLISRLLYTVFPLDKSLIDKAIDTVEKFQGSQRKYIIVSFGVGDPDIIEDEEEFLLNLNRTNVSISRAEDKVLILISDELAHHLPEDKEIIKTSKAIKSFVYQYCNRNKNYSVNDNGSEKVVNLRVRD